MGGHILESGGTLRNEAFRAEATRANATRGAITFNRAQKKFLRRFLLTGASAP
jgi:hypothetical protein